MSSSVGEAKKHIADAGEQVKEALKALTSATEAVDEALSLVKRAAEDSKDDDVQAALKGFAKALDAFGDAKKETVQAQQAAEKYVETLG